MGIVFLVFTMFLWPPITLTELALPSLAKISASNFAGFPTIGATAFILVWIADYAGAFFLMRDWANSPD